MIKFRALKENEIECRVGQASEKGVMLLLYKDARADMTVLDETVGNENWQRNHYAVKDSLFCEVKINKNYAVKGAPPEWIGKSDCGVESNTEAQKGESSDSFKRACVNWGIGRELYTAPFIWIKADDCNLVDTGRKDRYNKPVLACYDKFTVRKILVVDGKIVTLVIWNDKKRKFVFEYGTDYIGQ